MEPRKVSSDAFDKQNLEDAARQELELLWDDLSRARGSAVNGVRSLTYEILVSRIGMFTRLVGPTSWEKIQIHLLEDGTYQRIHADLGIDVDVDMVRVAETRSRINARH